MYTQRGAVPVLVIIIVLALVGGGAWIATQNDEPALETDTITEDNIAPPHDYEYDPVVEEQKQNEAKDTPVSTTPAQKPASSQPKPATATPPASTSTGSVANEQTSTTTPPAESQPVVEEVKNDNFISYTDNGFVPKTATITLIECTPDNTNCEENNTTIKFTNDSYGQMWVASDPYPTHYFYYDFDQHTSVSRGGSYQFTFPKKAGTYTYHNHSNPSYTGTIIIK